MSTAPTPERIVNAHEHRVVRLCPVCDSLSHDVIHVQTFVGHPRQDIKKCRSCGMVYADSGLTQFDYDTHYSERSKYFDIGADWFKNDDRRYEHTASWLSAFLNHSHSILDIGCANGSLLGKFQEHGYQFVTGYDPSEACRQATMRKSIPTISQIEGQYDCVTLSHVVEHLYDVRGVLSQAIAVTKNMGVLYIEVPDASKYRVVSPYQEFNIEHVNHFTMPTLCALAGRFGLAPLHVGEKEFAIGDGAPFAAIFGIFRKYPPNNLQPYLDGSEIKLRAIGERLEENLGGHPQVIVWGAGQLTLKLLHLPALKSRKVYLADTNTAMHGQRIGGIEVLPPAALFDFVCPIVIGSILNAKSIEESIRKLHLANPVVNLIP